jgi:hypothetical protein
VAGGRKKLEKSTHSNELICGAALRMRRWMINYFDQLVNLSIKELDEPSTSWVVRQIRAEVQEMLQQKMLMMMTLMKGI